MKLAEILRALSFRFFINFFPLSSARNLVPRDRGNSCCFPLSPTTTSTYGLTPCRRPFLGHALGPRGRAAQGRDTSCSVEFFIRGARVTRCVFVGEMFNRRAREIYGERERERDRESRMRRLVVSVVVRGI